MTNPNNAVGTNGAFGGRTSVNAFNDVMGAFQNSGVLSGWGIVPSSGMTVSCGGSGLVRDVAIAEDTNGNRTSVNNISGSAIDVTLNTAPASNSRYDAIVVYVDKPPMGSATQDNPECCGIIPVTGTAASTPSYPDDNTIRSAITADGASGATAYYAVIGYVLVASGTTTISSGMITSGPNVTIGTNRIADGSITSDKVDSSTFAVKTETLWSGELYQANDSVTLSEPLVAGQVYIFTVRGRSGAGYVLEFTYTYQTVYLEASYQDDAGFIRWRWDYFPATRKIAVNSASMNSFNSNTALIKIQKLVLSSH